MYCCSVVSNSLRAHGLHHTRFPSLSLSPRVCSNSSPSMQWCHLAIWFSAAFFSSCPHSFLASGCFSMSWLLDSGGQNIGASTSASVLPMNIQGWFPLGWTGLISLLSKGLLESSPAPQLESINSSTAFFMVQLSHLYMTTGKAIALTIQTFVGKVMCLHFNTLYRFVIAFLPRSKHLSVFPYIAVVCQSFSF